MTPLKIYTIRSKNTSNVWVFKYDLNGNLAGFEVLEGILNEEQISWFFEKRRFPYLEIHIHEWQKKLRANFEITIGDPDLSFENAWEIFGHKVDKKLAQSAWSKAGKEVKIKFFLSMPAYKRYLNRKGVAQISFERYVKREKYNDEFDKIK